MKLKPDSDGEPNIVGEELPPIQLVVESPDHVFEFRMGDLEFSAGGMTWDEDGSIAALKEAINNPRYSARESIEGSK